jgi:hypothetical protein
MRNAPAADNGPFGPEAFMDVNAPRARSVQRHLSHLRAEIAESVRVRVES